MAILTRQALYERVWAEPVLTVAAELGLSDLGLKKTCKKADIPVPQRGYWAKLRAGQNVKPAALPLREPGMPDVIYLGEHTRFVPFYNDPEGELAEPLPVEPTFEETLDQLRTRIAPRIGKVVNQRNLKAPHPLIGNLLAVDEKRRPKPREAPWRLTWDRQLFDSAFERRRLRLLSSIFRALQTFGAQPWVSDAEARKVGAVVGTERVEFLLDHPAAKPDRDGKWHTRGGWADELRLTIVSEGAQSWSDTEEHGLETHLTEIAVSLVVAAEQNYRASAHRAFQRALLRRRDLEVELARRREEADRKAHEAELAAEESRRAKLLTMAADLRAANDIRTLVERVLGIKGPDDVEASRWGAWALGIAKELDPSEQPLFCPVDRFYNAGD